MPAKWYDGKVIRIEDRAPLTKSYWLEVPDPFEFIPGQFITVDLPIHERRNKRWRSYSIANLPNQENLIELCIVYLEGGAASQYMFNEVEVGSTLTFKGPSGRFVLPQEQPDELIMICTGTGVAPFRSMIKQLQQTTAKVPAVHLIFGTRWENGILYRDEFETLQRASEFFTYDICLSRQPNWGGPIGYVHQIYQSQYSTLDPGRVFMLCGWSMMVDDGVAQLLELGYDKRQIRFELYG